MKKLAWLLMAVILALSVNVTGAFADAAGFDVQQADYYVYVATPDGGLNMRYGPGTEYSKVMQERIPDGVRLYIGLVSGNWGYTSYNGNEGWVALKQTTTTPPQMPTPPQTAPQAIPQPDIPAQPQPEAQVEVEPEAKTDTTTQAHESTADADSSELTDNTEDADDTEPVSQMYDGSEDEQIVKSVIRMQILIVALLILLVVAIAILAVIIINSKSKNKN